MSVHIRDLKLHSVDKGGFTSGASPFMKALEERGLSDDKTEKLLPNRTVCGSLQIQEQKGWNYGLDVLYFRLEQRYLSLLCA